MATKSMNNQNNIFKAIVFNDPILNTEDCWNCGGEGYSSHDCGEDTCCCLDPEPNILCDVCKGKGYIIIKGD